MALRWGIAGVGKVSNDFLSALESDLSDKQHLVVAVASRDVERSKKFAEDFKISKFYGSYEDLALDDNVEIVYIAVLNPFHFDVCQLMLKHGKHILCEKPFCMNSLQVKQVLDTAKNKNLFAMEGIWSRFFPAYSHLRNMFDTGVLGDIKEIYIKHGFKGENTDRIVNKDLGGGIVLDIGVYAIQFVLFCFRDEPKSIHATGKVNKQGVDLYFEATINFGNGRVAKIICSGLEEFENQAVVISTKGTVCIPTYWCPTSLVEPDCNIKTWWLPDVKREFNFTNSCGLRYEADEVLDCIRGGKLFSDSLLPKEMLLIAHIEDEIRRQIGVRYDSDRI